MKRISFVEPNFKCSVKRGSSEGIRLEHGATAEEVMRRLRGDGYTINSIEPYEFASWKQLADENRRAFTPTEKPYKFNADVWTAVKQYLFALAGNFCGYCETTVLPSSDGAVEHYRPKARVEEDPAHPGYYWLAYDITNYVPTCSRCNTGKGKRNRFPIQGTTRARDPRAHLASEKPLLLHPFFHDPQKHLTVVIEPIDLTIAEGMFVGLDLYGHRSVEVYDLNREYLLADRQKELENLRRDLKLALTDPALRATVMAKILEGRCAYSFACRALLAAWLQHEREQNKRDLEKLRRSTSQQATRSRGTGRPHRVSSRERPLRRVQRPSHNI